jgi:hypothetical protein
MIPDTLAELMALHAAGTPGERRQIKPGDTSHDSSVIDKDGVPYRIAEFTHARNAALIAAAVNALPALVAEVQALREERDRLRRDAAEQRMLVAGMKAWIEGEPSTPPVSGQPKRTLETPHE